jgi:aminopeptidase-like protein
MKDSISNDLPGRIEVYFDRLWPICRSITGPGFRESLDILSEIMPMERLVFKTGEKVLDWVVPEEWNPKDAYFIDPLGRKHADFKENNLHLLGYSTPFQGKMPLEQLKKHLYTLKNQPDAIPYVTSYYEGRWGFCLTFNELSNLPEGAYTVVIETELRKGELVVGEAVLPGDSRKEVLFSSYLCHPSLANNELSGPLVLSFLYEAVARMHRRQYTYRFVIVPETIGSSAFLSIRGQDLKKNLIAGYILTCIGDGGPFTYKRSRDGRTLADRAAIRFLEENGGGEIVLFDPAIGSDERQYCSPGFNLPVGSMMRTMYTRYPEYHTSLDNKSLIDFGKMVEAIQALEGVIRVIESNRTCVNLFPYGEPQLGRRGLFRSLSGKGRDSEEIAMWWLLNLCDGTNDLLDIATRSGHPFSVLARVAEVLENAGLLGRQE